MRRCADGAAVSVAHPWTSMGQLEAEHTMHFYSLRRSLHTHHGGSKQTHKPHARGQVHTWRTRQEIDPCSTPRASTLLYLG